MTYRSQAENLVRRAMELGTVSQKDYTTVEWARMLDFTTTMKPMGTIVRVTGHATGDTTSRVEYILQRIADGLTQKQIADELGVSGTVISKALTKAGAPTRPRGRRKAGADL